VAYPGVVGDIGYVPLLIGEGYFQVQYTGTKWEVVSGRSVAKILNPIDVLSAPSTSIVTTNLFVIPANMVSEGSMWEISCPSYSGAANVGSDSIQVKFSGSSVLSTSSAANFYPILTGRITRDAGYIGRPWMITSNTNLGAVGLGIDLSVDSQVSISVIPGAIGNAYSVRFAGLRRLY
jgi:hypothetical protein